MSARRKPMSLIAVVAIVLLLLTVSVFCFYHIAHTWTKMDGVFFVLIMIYFEVRKP